MATEHPDTSRIEHRLSKRKPIQLHLIIFQNHIPVSVGKTKDLCDEGMGIVSSLNNIKYYSTLKVGLALPRSTTAQYLRLSGLVVHKSDQAVGIAFNQMDVNTREMLNQLLADNILYE